jgi:cytochrome P450
MSSATQTMPVHSTAAAPAHPPKEPPLVRGLPLLGSTLDMIKDPARFFVKCYREYGPAYRVKILGQTYGVIAGVEAATFMGTKEGKECLRSREFWEGLLGEYGAKRALVSEDGETHKQLRDVMRRGYSKESIKGRYNELVDITDRALARAARCQWCRPCSTWWWTSWAPS